MEQTPTKNSLIGWWKKVVFENYANFKGRARRAEYWYFALANILLILPFYILAIVGGATESTTLLVIGVAIYAIVALAVFVPALAVAVRRLHDIGKSGWNYLIGLIPIVGPIILLVWFFTDGNRFTNKWGEDPKNPNAPAFDFEQASPAVQG